MRKYLVVLLLVAAPAFAQQPDPEQLTRLVNTLQAQRNQVFDMLAVSDAKVAELTAKVKALEAELDKLKSGGTDHDKHTQP